jgi:hypothetical protein
MATIAPYPGSSGVGVAGAGVVVVVGAGVAPDVTVGTAVAPAVGLGVSVDVGVGVIPGDVVTVGVGVVVVPPLPPLEPPPLPPLPPSSVDVKVTVVVLVKRPSSSLGVTSAVMVATPEVVPAVKVAVAVAFKIGADAVISPISVLNSTVTPLHIQSSPSHTVAVIVAVALPSATIAVGSAERYKAGRIISGAGG